VKGTIWRPAVQILKRRRLHGADRMDAADTAAEHGKADKIEVTWAVTALDPAKRLRIGKIWAPEGKKWLVADGVKRQAYVFELMRYPDLEAFSVDLESRMLAGVSAIVAGHLKRLPELDPLRAHPRMGNNFADDPSWLFQLDFDGLAAVNSKPIDRPEDFGAIVLREALRRLPAAFEKVDCVIYATSSSGLPFNAKGEPSGGRARFRVVFWLSRPVTFAEQGLFTQALKQLPGLDCLDESIFVLPQFSFVARPEFPDWMTDPIETPVMMHKGDRRCLDVDILLTEIDVEPASKGRSGTRGTPARAEDRRLDVAHELRVPLVRRAVAAIVNDLNRIDWVHFAHAIDGALARDPAGRDIFLEFSARWEGEADPYEDFDQVGEADQPEGWEEPDPEEEAERVWDTRGEEGRAGFGYLMQLLRKQETDEAEAAIDAIQLARAQEAFKDPPDDLPDNDDPEPAPARDPWSRLREELHWSGADRARNSGSGIAWREPGIAVFGSESREGMPRDRAWITDRHVRGYITTTNGLPTAGKSFLSVTFANAIATERHDLAGLDRIERPGAVVIIAADSEGAEEFQRKDAAFRQYPGLTNADFRHQIFIFDAPGPFVEIRAGSGTWGPSRWIIEQAPKLARMREDNKLALIVVDTLLGVSGGGNTADAVDMQAIIDVAKMLATVLDCAVEIINHLTKGGAKTDPGSMDAGLGARPITATARFVANLSKVNGVVTIVMPKESYMGGPQGTRCFEFKPVDVLVAIYDVDDSYVGVEPRSLGVLIPTQIAALERMAEDAVLAALWEAHQKGVKIKRGAAKGVQKDDHAALIIQKALDLGLNPQGRRKAEALVAKLLRDGRVKVVPTLDDKRNRFEQLVPDDPVDEI
jgi:hypothetical protein